MINNTKYSLFSQLGVVIVFIVCLIMSVYFSYMYNTTKNQLKLSIEYDSKISLIQLTNTMAPYIDSYSLNEYEKLMVNEMGHKNIVAVILDDLNMAKLTGTKKHVNGKIKSDSWEIIDYDVNNKNHSKKLQESFIVNRHDIINEHGIQIATLSIYSTNYFMENKLREIIQNAIVVAVVISLALLSSLFMVIHVIILKPIHQIIDNIQDSDKDGIPKNLLTPKGSIETSILANKINDMISTINFSRENLQESEYRWKFALEGSGDGLWDYNVITNDVYFSAQWKSMLGFKDNEIENRFEEWEKRVHPDDIKETCLKIQKYLDGKENVYMSEHRVLCKDTTYKWILARGVIVQRDQDGKPLRLIGTHTDISHRKKIEKKIKDQKEEFETIFKSAKDGIVIFDLRSNFLNFNDSYMKMTGYSKNELLNRSYMDLFIGEDEDSFYKLLEIVLENGSVENVEKSSINKYGKIITINMSLVLLPDQKRLLGVIKDVTEQKNSESQAKLASMGEMIGNIAHQWRQPLSIISTTASGLVVKKDFGVIDETYDIRPDMNMIVEQSQFLSKTIDDFRNFIKGESKDEILSIVNTVSKTLSITKPVLEDNYVQVISELESNFKIKCCENEFIQCLINIINNAKDALVENITDEKSRYIFISTDISGGHLSLNIKDTGGGIDNQIIKRIFEPYFTTKHQKLGTGIGLSMVHNILEEKYNITIDVVNKEFTYNGNKYKGASFTLNFKNEKVNEFLLS